GGKGGGVGGGLGLAFACDLVVASERARVGQPEINLGLIPGFGGTQRLVPRVGVGRAREIVYLGAQLSASEAHRIGLVDRVVPPERVVDEATKIALELAAKAPVALRQAKRAVQAASDTVLVAGVRFEGGAFGVAFASADRVEGLKAFLERRPPVWKGR